MNVNSNRDLLFRSIGSKHKPQPAFCCVADRSLQNTAQLPKRELSYLTNMNHQDDSKKLLRQQETKFIDQEFVESCAMLILDGLRQWANENIFVPLGGELTLSIPLLGAPNAGIRLNPERINHPQMEIRLSMLIEIYRDAFTFPLVSKRFAEETDTIKDVHSSANFAGQYFLFDDAMPEVELSEVAEQLREICTAMSNVVEEKGDTRVSVNDIRCRFLMFELTLTWIFFHELGHVIQKHYLLKHAPNAQNLDITFEEFSDSEDSVLKHSSVNFHEQNNVLRHHYLAGQARELMADIDGIELTLQYLGRTNRLNPAVAYSFFCSLGCMFQRFYAGYQENLAVVEAQHPHPAIRDQAAQVYLMQRVVNILVRAGIAKSADDAIPPLVYFDVRASVMVGLFSAHRTEGRSSTGELPSYMNLHSPTHEEEMLRYQRALYPHLAQQISQVLSHQHLVDGEPLRAWLKWLTAAGGWTTSAKSN